MVGQFGELVGWVGYADVGFAGLCPAGVAVLRPTGSDVRWLG